MVFTERQVAQQVKFAEERGYFTAIKHIAIAVLAGVAALVLGSL